MRFLQSFFVFFSLTVPCCASLTFNFFEHNGMDLILTDWAGPPMMLSTFPEIGGQIFQTQSSRDVLFVYPFVTANNENVMVVKSAHKRQKWICDAREGRESLLKVDLDNNNDFQIGEPHGCYLCAFNDLDVDILRLAYRSIGSVPPF